MIQNHAIDRDNLDQSISDALGLRIDYLDGTCPVQADGLILGTPFYFRARGESWRFSVGNDPVGVSVGATEGWSYTEQYGDGEPFTAGWMTNSEALGFIHKAAGIYKLELEDE